MFSIIGIGFGIALILVGYLMYEVTRAEYGPFDPEDLDDDLDYGQGSVN